MDFIIEPSKKIRVSCNADVCVLGGSCTGVFAAVRAARLGAKVVIIEKQNCFGGTACSGLVNIWHTLHDTEFRRQIIAGLTQEVIERLKTRNAVTEERETRGAFKLNTEELKIELDGLIRENGIQPYLHTAYTAPLLKNGELTGVFIENKSGRSVVKSKMFIDATGDGDLCFHLGLDHYTRSRMQPPTPCAKIFGLNSLDGFDWHRAVHEHGEEFGLKEDWGWSCPVPVTPDVMMTAETHIFDADCSDADQLTFAEMEGRRQIRSIMDIIRKYGPRGETIDLLSLPSCIGIRETRHIKCRYPLTEKDILNGRRFDDAIANGSYRVDVHHSDKPGITFRYLNGVEEVHDRRCNRVDYKRWRPETKEDPTFYQIPFRSLIPGTYNNLISAGRMIDAEEGAFGAVRVMVNTNQMGEAAGTAAWLALDTDEAVERVDSKHLRKILQEGGSIII